MFRVVIPPIIRSTYNCNYSIWHWSNRLCYLPLMVETLERARCCNYSYMCSWWWVELPHDTCRTVYRNIINSTIAEGSRDGLTSARCCNYSYMCSWWWVELPHDTCRTVYRNIRNKLYTRIVASCWTIIDIYDNILLSWNFQFQIPHHSSLHKYNKLYIVAFCWTIIDIYDNILLNWNFQFQIPHHSSLHKYNKLYIVTFCWTIIDIDSRCTDPWT